MSKSAMSFFDSHCHFDFPAFDLDRIAVWQKANAHGVSGIFIPGVNASQWHRAADAVAELQMLSGALTLYGVGLHPYWYREWLNLEECLDSQLLVLNKEMHTAAQSEACRAIGETGLDKTMLEHRSVHIAIQLKIVSQHISLANALYLPVILHCRKAHNELIQLLDEHPPKAGGILHGFTGSAQLAMEYWKRGIHIGVGGSITYPRANKTRDAIKALPNEALVLETDAPDMPLCGRQGERNSPEYLPLVADALAELRNQPIEAVADYCYQNTCRVFAL